MKTFEIPLKEKDYFSKQGIKYDSFSSLALSVYQANMEFIDKFQNQRILEIGCGSDSIIHERCKSNWEGIDVVEKDRHGNPSLATKFGSVHDIPFESGLFDVIIPNQSIEHWHEYGVGFKEAFDEMNRVLKISGKIVLNFPIHLHGHKYFVRNNLDPILNQIESSGFKINLIKCYVFDPPYKGWSFCGFPTIYVKYLSKKFLGSSRVFEIEAEKVKQIKNFKRKKLKKQKSKISKRLHHGLMVVIYSIIRKILRK
ncbi:MAG: class I SAM-dependent methyltransferase [Flavobacteriaceae bacterium]